MLSINTLNNIGVLMLAIPLIVFLSGVVLSVIENMFKISKQAGIITLTVLIYIGIAIWLLGIK